MRFCNREEKERTEVLHSSLGGESNLGPPHHYTMPHTRRVFTGGATGTIWYEIASQSKK